MRSVELFAGAGGLAIGTSLAGFEHDVVLERDHAAVNTIRENQRRGVQPAAHWPQVKPTDVTSFDFSTIKPELELISGGVPCQPWSQGGVHRGPKDARNLFPEVVRIVRQLQLGLRTGVMLTETPLIFTIVCMSILIAALLVAAHATQPQLSYPQQYQLLQLPEMPGATVTSVGRQSTSLADGIRVDIETAEEVAAVLKFFRERLLAGGWTETPSRAKVALTTIGRVEFTKDRMTYSAMATRRATTTVVQLNVFERPR